VSSLRSGDEREKARPGQEFRGWAERTAQTCT